MGYLVLKNMRKMTIMERKNNRNSESENNDERYL